MTFVANDFMGGCCRDPGIVYKLVMNMYRKNQMPSINGNWPSNLGKCKVWS